MLHKEHFIAFTVTTLSLFTLCTIALSQRLPFPGVCDVGVVCNIDLNCSDDDMTCTNHATSRNTTNGQTGGTMKADGTGDQCGDLWTKFPIIGCWNPAGACGGVWVDPVTCEQQQPEECAVGGSEMKMIPH